MKLTYTSVPVLLFVVALGLPACSPDPNQLLAGEWSLASITSSGPLPEYKVEDFRFVFTEEGKYQYFGNLYYEEAGNYTVESSYLYTTDTLNEASSEKVVQIIKLTRDSLFLRMADETLMKLGKKK